MTSVSSGVSSGRVLPDGAQLCRRLAPWVAISQTFTDRALPAPGDELRRQIRDHGPELGLVAGARVAVAVGSRGIAELPTIVAALVGALRDAGTVPFVVPAMGSHGGGTADGQVTMLASLGVTEDAVGAPIRSGMDTVVIGAVEGIDVHVDRIAATEADVIVPVARVKPHTDFRGAIESGVLKMLSIGLGKHRGADSLHRVPADRMSSVIASAGALVVDTLPVAFAVAVIEDAYDHIGHVEVVPRAEITRREPELLRIASSWMPSLPFRDVDVLVVEEMGKDISGSGMDPNITGRFYDPRPDAVPRVGVLVVLSLTGASHGNATGMGIADVVTSRLAQRVDWRATYTNEVAARMLAGPKLPLVAADDEDALAVAVHCLGMVRPEDARVAWIRNTLSLSRMRVSLPLWEELRDVPTLSPLGAPQRPQFRDGRLVGLDR